MMAKGMMAKEIRQDPETRLDADFCGRAYLVCTSVFVTLLSQAVRLPNMPTYTTIRGL
jgi:hypothetical protein